MPGINFFSQTVDVHSETLDEGFALRNLKDKAPLLAVELPFYLKELEQYNDNLRINYLTAEKNKRLQDQVAAARALLQLQLGRGYNKQSLADIKSLDKLLVQLTASAAPPISSNPTEAVDAGIIEIHNHAVGPAVGTLKYCALSLSRSIAELCNDFPKSAANSLEQVKSFLGSLNSDRLYWVWGGFFTSSIMSMFATTSFGNLPEAQSAYNYGAGHLGYFLYFARFFFEEFALFRLVFIGPWMTEAEKEYANLFTVGERFFAQLDKRKFILINDFFWSIANCLCFLKLTGSQYVAGSKTVTFGDTGNYLTLAIFVIDIIVSIWQFIEAEKQYENDMLRLQGNLGRLKERKEELYPSFNFNLLNGQNRQMDNALRLQERQLEVDILEQEKLIRQVNLDWKYQRKDRLVSIYYACMLFLSYSVGCTVLLPSAMVALNTALTCSLVGSLLCFAFTIGTGIYKGHLAIEKAKEEAQLLRHDCEALLKKFNKLRNKEDKSDEDLKVLTDLYLQIHGLMKEAVEKETLTPYKQAQLTIESIAQSIFPGLLMISFMSLSAGPAAGVVVGVMAAFFIAYMLTMYFEKNIASQIEPDLDNYIKDLNVDLEIADFNQQIADTALADNKGLNELLDGLKGNLAVVLTFAFSPVIGVGLVLAGLSKLIIDACVEDGGIEEEFLISRR